MEESIKLIVKKVATGGLTTEEGSQLLIALMNPIEEQVSYTMTTDEEGRTYYTTIS